MWLLAIFLNLSRQRPVSISRGIPHQVRKEHYTSQIEKSKRKKQKLKILMMETSDTVRMLTPRTCNTKQLYTTLSKNTGSIRQRWIELVEKEAKEGQWCCVEKHWDMKCWFSALAMCPIIVFEFWGQEVSSIALCGSNESVLELFLFLPRKYKLLLSSLCPTVRLISKLMVSVANIFCGVIALFHL